MFLGGRPVPHADLVLPRIGASITNYGLAVVRQFDMMGVPVLNTAVAIARSRDKLRAMQLLTKKTSTSPRRSARARPTRSSSRSRSSAGRRHREAPAGRAGHRDDDRRDAPGGDVPARDALGHGAGHHPAGVHRRVEGPGLPGHRRRRARHRVDAARRPRQASSARTSTGEASASRAARQAVRPGRRLGREGHGARGRRRGHARGARRAEILEINSSPGLEGIERTSGVDVAGAIMAHAERSLASRRKRKLRRDAVIEAERRTYRLKSDEATMPPPRRRAPGG